MRRSIVVAIVAAFALVAWAPAAATADGGQATAAQKAKAKPKPAPPAGGLVDGTYHDGDLAVELTGNRSRVTVHTTAPKCAGSIAVRLQSAFGGGRASGEESPVGTGTVDWSLTLAADLTYSFTATWDLVLFEGAPACKEVVRRSGKLSR